MGYYTYYNFEMNSENELPKSKISQINKAFIQIWERRPYEEIEWPWQKPSEDDLTNKDFISFWYLNESLKWYEWETDMKALAQQFPDVCFTLTGEGEDRDDNWRACWYKGQFEIVHGHIIYEQSVIYNKFH